MIRIQPSGGSTGGGGKEGPCPLPPARRQVIFGGHIFIDLTVQIRCFVTIYIIIWANTQFNQIVFGYLWYAIFKV